MSSFLPLAGVVGWPVHHSRSPQVHAYWLARYNLSGTYVPLPVAVGDLETVLSALPSCGFKGVNVTIPHKEQAFLLADTCTEVAQRLKAANTLYFRNGTIMADNTDGFGFVENILENTSNYDWSRPALVLGAGGAGRAIVDALLTKGASKVYLTNRTFERTQKLIADFDYPVSLELLDWSQRESVNAKVGLIVNTTSLGMKGQNPLRFNFEGASPKCIVTDIVYTPLETMFLSSARQSGLTVVDGLGMLLHQARPGFQKWFGAGIDPVVDQGLREVVLPQDALETV